MIGIFMDDHYTEIFAVMPALMLIAGMLFSVWIDPYIQKYDRRVMYMIGVLVLSLIAENYCDYLLESGPPMIMLRTAIDIYGYSIRPVILLLFMYIVSPRKNYKPAWILIAVNALIHLTALFTDICFTIDEANNYQGGLPVLNRSCLITSMILLGVLLYLSFREYRLTKRRESWIPVLVVFIIIISLFVDGNIHTIRQPVSFLTIAISISCVLYYIWLHFRFVGNYQRALAAEQRIQIMMKQIQPHFLYNTLATVRSLCLKSPETAAEVIEKFSRYLRQNLSTLDYHNLIPFRQELEHVRIYTDIEMQMFPYIHILYDIEDEDFDLPVLTVQPIVENSIRHGVRAREDGRVSITTRRDGMKHMINISDNGLGFDPDAVLEKEGDHIGISNVRERLETLCKGTLVINSTPGEGTEVIITIPAGSDDRYGSTDHYGRENR